MMTSKRMSCRQKKIVQYADQEGSNYGSDDDFEDEFEPPSKKAKTKVVNVKDLIKQQNSEKKPPRQRISVEEKVYQRDIEKALKISRSNPTSERNEDRNVTEKVQTNNVQNRGDSDYDPEQETCVSEDDSYNEGKENTSDSSEDETKKKPVYKERKKTKNTPSENTKNKQVTSAKSLAVKEKDLSTSEISTVGEKSKSAKAKVGERGKIPSLTSGNVRTSPTVNRNLSSLGLGGVVIKNPGPPIRVGLSRNIKVKPLHSNVSVPR